MRLVPGLCLMLLLGATVASAESPTPFKFVNLFKYEDARVWTLQAAAEEPAPMQARGIRLAEFTVKREHDRVHRAQLTIGAQYAPSVIRAGDVRGQALVTVQVTFRTLQAP